MKLFNALKKGAVIKAFAGITVLGLLFSAVSAYILFFAEKTVFETVNAEIVSIEESYDAFLEQYTHQVFVDYAFNGKAYTGAELGSYSSSMKPGDIIEIEVDTAEPTHIQGKGSDSVPYVVLAVGIICFAGGLVCTVKSIRKPAADYEEYDRTAAREADSSLQQEVLDSTEPTNTYFFRFDGKLKQGYRLEDENHRMIYEAKMLRFSPVKAFEYELTNHVSGITKTAKIGHTVSSSVGSGFGFQMPVSSAFTIDGIKNWDYLADNGFGFSCERKGIMPCFRVRHHGVEVAYIETTGADVFGEKETKNPLYKLPVNGHFRVECRDSDLDMIFMTCLSIARAIFYENN